MGRNRKFTDDQLLDAALDAVVTYGRAATLAQVSRVGGVPTGSIYHRFASRDELMIRLWLRSIERFHARLFETVARVADPGEALVALAVATSRYCRENPEEALAMTLFRHDRLMRIVPDVLRDRAAHVNDRVFGLMAELGARRFPLRAHDPALAEMVFTCVVGLCYGLIRPYIVAGAPIPAWLDAVVERGCTAALTIGDERADRWARLGVERRRQDVLR